MVYHRVQRGVKLLKKKIFLILVSAVLVAAFVAATVFLVLDLIRFGKKETFKINCEAYFQNEYVAASSNGTELESLYADLEGTDLNEYEKNVRVLKALGISDEIVESMGAEDINKILADALSVQVKEQYFTIDEKGKAVKMEEDAFMERYHEGASDGIGDCMRITLVRVYLDPSSNGGEKGWFEFHVWYEWLMPDARKHEYTLSMKAEGFSWSDRLQSDYSSGYYYTVKDSDGNERHHSERFGDSACQFTYDGYMYQGEIPENGVDSTVTYLQYYLSGKGAVSSPAEDYIFNLTAKYESNGQR